MNSDLIKQLRIIQHIGSHSDLIGEAIGAIQRHRADLIAANDRIAELEAALLVRLDRKVLNDTWRNRAEKAEAALDDVQSDIEYLLE